MTAMMSLDKLNTLGVFASGLIMGLSYGFFWSNRDFLALSTTQDGNRNYYYGVETFFYTITGIGVPLAAGVFISATDKNGWFNGNVNVAYYILTGYVLVVSVLASILVHRGNFQNPPKTSFIFFKFDKLWNKRAIEGFWDSWNLRLQHNWRKGKPSGRLHHRYYDLPKKLNPRKEMK